MTTCRKIDCDALPEQGKTWCEDHRKQAKKASNSITNAEMLRGKRILRVLLQSKEGRAIVEEIETGRWLKSSIKGHESAESDDEPTADDETKEGLTSNDDTKEEPVTDAEKNKEMQSQIDDLTAQLQKLKVIVKEAATFLSVVEKL
ncbi:hypothetical protein K457DRAFT_159928 [Linnemannia elongata AG-77]|uniref:Uncharacterized protein n=1 Tax=Linnemannia elongata AG-77 TaxID=1314771 RepID=A0A197JCV2_9FUNG|nr:hypothetical protein K457DRAFT_159928 [Linnemannia elongata AG-77]